MLKSQQEAEDDANDKYDEENDEKITTTAMRKTMMIT